MRAKKLVRVGGSTLGASMESGISEGLEAKQYLRKSGITVHRQKHLLIGFFVFEVVRLLEYKIRAGLYQDSTRVT